MKSLAAAAIVAGSVFALHAAGVAQMTQADSGESQGRRICRYMDETGKLAARRRVCMTKAEWDRTAEEQRRSGQQIISSMDSCGARADGGSAAISINQGGGANTFTSGGC